MYEGDDHALTRNAADAGETLCRFIAKCAGVDIEAGENEVGIKPSAGLEEPENDR